MRQKSLKPYEIPKSMIVHLIINALFINGLYKISQEGYLLYWYRLLMEKVPFFNSALISCVICMASIYGTLYYWIFISESIQQWIFYVISLSALNYIVCLIISILVNLNLFLDYKIMNNDNDK